MIQNPQKNPDHYQSLITSFLDMCPATCSRNFIKMCSNFFSYSGCNGQAQNITAYSCRTLLGDLQDAGLKKFGQLKRTQNDNKLLLKSSSDGAASNIRRINVESRPTQSSEVAT